AVDDALRVRHPDRARDLPRQPDGQLAAELAALPEQRRQRLPLEVLHDDVGPPVGEPAEIVDVDEARVLEQRREARLVEEAGDDEWAGRSLMAAGRRMTVGCAR